MDLYEEFEITRIERDEVIDKDDLLIKEFPLTIEINGRELVTLVCSPADIVELAAGYLFSEGLINSGEEILSSQLQESRLLIELTDKDFSPGRLKHRVITSGCGKSTIFTDLQGTGLKKIRADLRVKKELIFDQVTKLYKRSELFKLTGGVHNALLFDPEKHEEVFREDIGRHNTVDKIIGNIMINGKRAETKLLIISGRISAEILLKTVRAGIPVLVSPSAPTDLAVRLAYRLGVTLIGFVRGQRMNIYCHKERIIIQEG